jgi:hypothetical protein
MLLLLLLLLSPPLQEHGDVQAHHQAQRRFVGVLSLVGMMMTHPMTCCHLAQ